MIAARNEPAIVLLGSKYIHVRYNGECWAQFPANWVGETIPDEYIFHPEYSRDRINAWWTRWRRDSLLLQVASENEEPQQGSSKSEDLYRFEVRSLLDGSCASMITLTKEV